MRGRVPEGRRRGRRALERALRAATALGTAGFTGVRRRRRCGLHGGCHALGLSFVAALGLARGVTPLSADHLPLTKFHSSSLMLTFFYISLSIYKIFYISFLSNFRFPMQNATERIYPMA